MVSYMQIQLIIYDLGACLALGKAAKNAFSIAFWSVHGVSLISDKIIGLHTFPTIISKDMSSYRHWH